MKQKTPVALPKTPTGIAGLDEVTGGGFPKGRPTLLCGSAGCGKTLFGIQFLTNGILQHNEYLMVKDQFTLSYNNSKGTPNWVSWHLSTAWKGTEPRCDCFMPDAALPSTPFLPRLPLVIV